MLRTSRFRMVFALVFAVAAGAVGAAPAMAETQLHGCTRNSGSSAMGACSDWEVYDASVGKKGAVCVYASSYPYKLNRITVRPPLMHGAYTQKSKVGWRFIVQRMSNGGGSWNSIFTSSYQTALANDAIPAYVGHGFSRRAWSAPSNPGMYFYRILIDLQWWAKNSGPVEGYIPLKYDWYKRISGNNTDTQPNYCLPSF